MKRNESIWHALTAGIDAKTERKKLWYVILPGIYVYAAVTLGRTRKLLERQHLILFRNENSECKIGWVSESELMERL